VSKPVLLKEEVPKCRFCGGPVYEGSEVKGQFKDIGTMHLCEGCRELIEAVIEDALPNKLGIMMDVAEENLTGEMKLKPFRFGGGKSGKS